MDLFEKILVALLFVALLGVVENQGRVIQSQRRIVVASVMDSINLTKCQGELIKLKTKPKRGR